MKFSFRTVRTPRSRESVGGSAPSPRLAVEGGDIPVSRFGSLAAAVDGESASASTRATPAVDQSSTRTLRAAVIGTGRISEEHLRFLSGSARAELVAVCDLSPALAHFAVERFGAAHAETDYREMLAHHRPEVVHVLTPAHAHVGIVTDCLDSGAHVIVEKPVAPTRVEFQRLVSLAEQRNRRLIEDHNYRFNQPVQRMERLVAQGRIGDVREVEVRMSLRLRDPSNRYCDANLPHPSHRLPAGVLHEFISHLCYLALRFMPDHGPNFDHVSAAWGNLGGGDLFKYDDLDASFSIGDVCTRIRFSATTRPDCFTVTVRGTEGTAGTDLFQPHVRLECLRRGGAQLAPAVNQWLNGWHLVGRSIANFTNKVRQRTPYEGLGRFLSLTYDALAEGTEPPVSIHDMDRTNRLIDTLLDERNRR